MDFNRINQEIKAEKLFLKPITTDDRAFINGMFNDTEIKRYYIVPKEAQQDYKRLVDYWLNDIRNGAGTCWIINEKGNGIFARDRQVGFVAFEFRDTLKNARISYAILPEFRNKGFATNSVELIINSLKQEGVERIEADIDRDNLNSEKVVEKLGFTANKRNALVDPEMMRDGEIRMRALWFKELYDYSQLDFFVIKQPSFNILINSRTVFKVWEEEVSEGANFGFMSPFNRMKTTGRYHFSFNTNVTEKLVGISKDETVYNITWELLREESHKGKKFLVFCGWGDQMSTGKIGGLPQFNYYEIGVEKPLFANLLANLMSNNSEFFSINKMKNVIGLEGFVFEDGQIRVL